MKTKLEKAVARLQAFADDPQANDSAWNIGDLRALLAAYREARGQGLTRAERAVVRAAMHWFRADGQYDYAPNRSQAALRDVVRKLEAARAKAEKARKR